jgi:hypothetical protein
MSKMVFINEGVFESDGDYVIGGFTTDKIEDFNLTDFKVNLRQRVQRLIDEYIERATLYNAEIGNENPSAQAHKDVALMLFDNLKIEVPYTDSETLLEAIINNDKAQRWIYNIRYNIENYDYKTVTKYIGIYNEAVEIDRSSSMYMDAKYFTEESTLESLIEQISIIEL